MASDERSSAIDFFNQHKLIFEEFNYEKMINTFLPDAVVYYTHGLVRGHENMKDFLKNKYGFFSGISRHTPNHVVDRDEDGGLIVRYQEVLVRYGWEGDDLTAINAQNIAREDGLPAIWWVGRIIGRLIMMQEGWKISERHMGAPFRDGKLDPPNAPNV